jgi:hypothetical protein
MKTNLFTFSFIFIIFSTPTWAQTYSKAQVDSLLKVKIDSILHHAHHSQQAQHQPKKRFEYALGLDGSLNFGNLRRFIISSRSNLSLVGGRYLWFSLSPYLALGEQNGIVQERELTTDLNMTAFYSRPFYCLVFATAEKSNLRAIEWRTLAGIGVGYHWFKNPRINLQISNALTYENTDFVGSADVLVYRNSTRLRLNYHFFQKKLLFSHTAFFQPALNMENWRWSNLLHVDVPVNKVISLRLSGLTTYESLVAEGRQNYDTRLTFGIVVKN